MKRLWLSLGGGSLAAVIWTAAAWAQSPTQGVYGGDAGGTQGEVEGGATAGAAGGTLPFTGMDLALMAVAAALLIATGLVIRRVTRTKTAAS